MKNKVIDIVSSILKKKNILDFEENTNLIASGHIDSLEFIEIISLIEDEFDLEIDFLEIEPTEIATINGIVKYLESQV